MEEIERNEDHITVAQIGGKNVSYDVCCDNRETYRWQEENTGWRYLGKGVIWSINGASQNSKRVLHFWKK